MQLFKNPNYDFLRWRWHALALSTLVIAAGLALMFSRGVPLGIDFSGGTIVIVRFQNPTSEQSVRDALETMPGDKVVQTFGDPGANEILIRLPQVEEGVSDEALGEAARDILAALDKANLGSRELLSTEVVGPVVGADLQRRGIYATLTSILVIMAYIAFRFRVSFAIGSMIATFHDVLVTLACLVVFRYELSLNIVAAMLTMIGYSVNDMIVIFDRVRENSRLTRREGGLEKVINDSINQTLARTVITSGTIFLSVLALYLFGGPVLEGFAFTMLAGTIATTYSGWFIAPSIAILLSKRARVARAPAAESLPQSQAKSRSKARKARAS
jgi:preprotein translocase subunit SecF